MHVTIRLFARLRELTGASEIPRDLPDGATVRQAWELLTREFPAIASYERSLSAAVNADYARFTTPLSDGDEVAFLPPVSGGEAEQGRHPGLGTRDRGPGRTMHVGTGDPGPGTQGST